MKSIKYCKIIHTRLSIVTEHSYIGIYTWYIQSINSLYNILSRSNYTRGHHVRDHMVVGFATTYAIGACHHWCCGVDSHSGRRVQHYVIKLVNDLRQVGGFLRVLRFPQPIKLTVRHYITDILLKVAFKPQNKAKTKTETIKLYDMSDRRLTRHMS